MKEHYYKLTYVNDDVETTVKFNADVTITTLRENMESFLAAAGWGEFNINKFFGVEE